MNFKKPRFWLGTTAVVIFVAIGVVLLTNGQYKAVNKEGIRGSNVGPIVIDELRTVIPYTLEVTKTISDYAHGQHIVWVEGRFKSSDKELSLTFIDDKGKQLENGVRKADEIKPIDNEWLSFRHKLIETTGKITDTQNVTVVFHLKQDGKNVKGLLTVPAKQFSEISKEPTNEQNDTKSNGSRDNKNWEVVSRADRVQGTITELDMTDDILYSVTLTGIRRIILPNNPIDYDFAGQTFHIVFNEELSKAGNLKDKLKKGVEIVVTFAQYAIPPNGKNPGKSIIGAYLSEIYYFENGKYYDIQGKEVDLLPSSDPEFLTKPQMELPVDLEIERYEQNQVNEGHEPWKLDPVQVTQDYIYNRVSSEDRKVISFKVIQKTEKVAIIAVTGENSSIKNVYLKRLVKQDDTGIWSIVGFDPKNTASEDR
ncbi:hypothetical protein [Desulfosporosinus sp. OT]|uniref:hypothetical protein n=1 Tax=Desulfosporosinus sp. OT TaxID=913865 RepID=UPI000223ACFB|nr:hypothetical protein [Desulfosporosinus sp. OT]EGW41781.1 hypothetical protein DOT_0258 [Desulfosporosinus sp. OT]